MFFQAKHQPIVLTKKSRLPEMKIIIASTKYTLPPTVCSIYITIGENNLLLLRIIWHVSCAIWKPP